MRGFISFLIVGMMFAVPTAHADWVLKQEIKTDMQQAQGSPGMKNVPGMGPSSQTQTMFTRADAVRIEQEDGQVTIMRLRGKNLSAVIIDPAQRTYSDATQMLPMMSMAAMFFVDCNQQGVCKERANIVTPAGNETRVISGFKTRKAKMNVPKEMMFGSNSTPTVWMTKDSKALAEEERARMMLFAKGLAGMGMPANNLPELVKKSYDKVAKQFGVPVETVMDMGVMKSTTRVLAIEEKKLSDDLFEVPKGYKQTAAFPPMPQGMPAQ